MYTVLLITGCVVVGILGAVALDKKTSRTRAWLFFLALGVAVGAVIMGTRGTTVCHAVTEDSAITDCDYRNGGWYVR